jgi:hypothetical protein
MLLSIFSSKNQKLVKGWVKEHQKIVNLAYEIIATHSRGDLVATKKALLALNKVAVMHLMMENVEFYRLLKDEKRADEEIKNL